MRCVICNTDSDTINFAQGEFSPCADCQTAIYECLAGYEDVKPEDDGLVEEEFDVGC